MADHGEIPKAGHIQYLHRNAHIATHNNILMLVNLLIQLTCFNLKHLCIGYRSENTL